MLEIRMIPTRTKGLRVDVFRRYKSVDPKTQKPKLFYKQLGSFPLGADFAPELFEQLEPDEVVQLQNWQAETRFAESLNISIDQLEKSPIRIPAPLLSALTQLSIEASRVGIDFIPHQIILNHLLQQAHETQTQIDLKNGFASGILAKAGLPAQQDTLEENNCASDPETKALFQTLIDLEQPIGRTCTELEAAAARYGKTKKIPPNQVREWAGQLKHRNTHKRIRKWCYALAIDVLHQHKINATHLMSPARVADFWIRQNASRFSVLEAPAAFIQLFEVSPIHHAAVINAISRLYAIHPLTTPHAQTSPASSQVE